MRRIKTTQDQVSISVALKLRLYFQMREKEDQTKSCTRRTAQAETQQFLPCCHCMHWFNCNQKTVNEPQESVILSCESPPPPPFPPPPTPPGPADSAPKHSVFPP